MTGWIIGPSENAGTDVGSVLLPRTTAARLVHVSKCGTFKTFAWLPKIIADDSDTNSELSPSAHEQRTTSRKEMPSELSHKSGPSYTYSCQVVCCGRWREQQDAETFIFSAEDAQGNVSFVAYVPCLVSFAAHVSAAAMSEKSVCASPPDVETDKQREGRRWQGRCMRDESIEKSSCVALQLLLTLPFRCISGKKSKDNALFPDLCLL
jgi:hypothetical protein